MIKVSNLPMFPCGYHTWHIHGVYCFVRENRNRPNKKDVICYYFLEKLFE